MKLSKPNIFSYCINRIKRVIIDEYSYGYDKGRKDGYADGYHDGYTERAVEQKSFEPNMEYEIRKVEGQDEDLTYRQYKPTKYHKCGCDD